MIQENKLSVKILLTSTGKYPWDDGVLRIVSKVCLNKNINKLIAMLIQLKITESRDGIFITIGKHWLQLR